MGNNSYIHYKCHKHIKINNIFRSKQYFSSLVTSNLKIITHKFLYQNIIVSYIYFKYF